MSYCYEYPHPAVTVDCVVFGWDEVASELKILLIKRKNDPFKDQWALPGGFVEMNEGLGWAARRELKEETGVELAYLEQLRTFGEPGRDPRERVVTVAYIGLVNSHECKPIAGSDASDVRWFPIDEIWKKDGMSLAFDHDDIMTCALHALKKKAWQSPVVLKTLMPETFTMSEARGLYRGILGHPPDKRNFAAKMRQFKILHEDGMRRAGNGHSAKVYRINQTAFEKSMRRIQDA